MTKVSMHDNIFNRDFWANENLKYTEPVFRLNKIAHTLTQLSQGKKCDLLDIGCGPAALAKLLPNNINYFGIDIAIHDNTPNFLEMDILTNKIQFGDKRFDLVVASGLFEYLGKYQKDKLSDIRDITKANGYFIMSYVNFDHIIKYIGPRYSNVQSSKAIKKDIENYFKIKRKYPTFHDWGGANPKPRRTRILQAIQSNLNFCIPVISPLFAMEFIYICIPRHLSRV